MSEAQASKHFVKQFWEKFRQVLDPNCYQAKNSFFEAIHCSRAWRSKQSLSVTTAAPCRTRRRGIGDEEKIYFDRTHPIAFRSMKTDKGAVSEETIHEMPLHDIPRNLSVCFAESLWTVQETNFSTFHYCYPLNGTVEAHATKAFGIGSYRTDRRLEKRYLPVATYPASCSALMGGCKETVHPRYCHWLATGAAFTAKAVAWPTAHASGNGRPQTTSDTPKGVQNRV